MQLISSSVNDRRRAGVTRPKQHQPKTDMTPMGDLGFLLISFFVMTTELGKPRVTSLYMPKEGPSTPLGNSNALTVLLAGPDNVYYYEGNWKDAVATNRVIKTELYSTDRLRKIIMNKRQWLDAHDRKEGRHGLMMLIKSTEKTLYKNVIDALDETMINDVRKYALVTMEPEETDWIKNNR